MKPDEFWELSFSEFHAVHHAYWLRYSRDVEQTRFLAQFLHPQVSKKPKTGRQLWPLPLIDDVKPIQKSKRWEFDKKDHEDLNKFRNWLKNSDDANQ